MKNCTYECMRLWKGKPCGCLVDLGTNCTAQHDPLPEICGACSHSRASHTPGKTPPCERPHGEPCFCVKFKEPAPPPEPAPIPTLAAFKEAHNPAPISTVPETSKLSNPKEAFGSNKLPLHLWPSTATAVGCLAFLHGALKYGKHNWRNAGVRVTTYVDALYRHMAAWYEGEDLDPDSGLSHLAHALACIAVLVDAEAAGKLNDDRAYPGGYGKLTAELTKLVVKLKVHADLDCRKEPKHYTRQDRECFGGGCDRETLAGMEKAGAPAVCALTLRPECSSTGCSAPGCPTAPRIMDSRHSTAWS